MVDLILGYLEQWEKDGLKNPELDAWLARFRGDKFTAAKAYWREVRRGIDAALQDGADRIPDMLTKGQQQKTAGKP